MKRPLAAAGVSLALALSACTGNQQGQGAGPPPASAPGPAAASDRSPAQLSTVAEARLPRIDIHETPQASTPRLTLDHPQPSGAPLVFLVQERRPGWLKVLLPVRPNGSSGWVRESEVRTSRHPFRVVVELGAHRITVYKGDEIFLQEPVGVGKGNTPTPGGLYYIKELIMPTDDNGRYSPDGFYGPYAYGLSGFSNVLTSFAGGEGVIGIHGTNEPQAIGKDVSNGCIRMSNTGVTKLANTLPLGVPVEIRS